MVSPIRSTNLWGYGDLLRELGAEPRHFLSRFRIPVDIEHEEDAFISFEAFVQMLDATAEEKRCSFQS